MALRIMLVGIFDQDTKDGSLMKDDFNYDGIINGIEKGAEVTGRVIKEGVQITKDVLGSLLSGFLNGLSSAGTVNEGIQSETNEGEKDTHEKLYCAIAETVGIIREQVASLRKNLENELQSIQSYIQKNEELQKENNKILKDLADGQENIAKLRFEINEKNNELEVLKKEKAETEEYKSKVENLQEKISKLRNSYEEKISESDSKKEQLEESNRDLKRTLEEKEEILNSKSEELEEIKKAYEAQVEEINNFKETQETLEDDLEKCNIIMSVPEEQLKKIDCFSDEIIEKLNNTIESKEAALVEEKVKNRKLTQDSLRLRIEIDTSNKELDKCKQKLKEFEDLVELTPYVAYCTEKDSIIDELNTIKNQDGKYKLDAEFDNLECIIFLSDSQRKQFWKDINKISSGQEINSIDLTDGCFLLKRPDKYAIYYKLNELNAIEIIYVDCYAYSKKNYNKFKDIITNSYLLSNDQIRYKVYDIIKAAKTEILILMPWINEHGWDKDDYVNTSIEKELKAALSNNSSLKIVIKVGYDIDHPNKDKEVKTREMAIRIKEEFSKYGERFKIVTDIGTHEKIITVDDFCALVGSYNLLSNNAPYNEKPNWASESMTIFENPSNIERNRKHIIETKKK